MNTCHQCGSDVAENDAFCPFCGISLQPVNVPAEDDEFASTIIMAPDEAVGQGPGATSREAPDRKSTRLNSSHRQ